MVCRGTTLKALFVHFFLLNVLYESIGCIARVECASVFQYDTGTMRVMNCPFWATRSDSDCHPSAYRSSLLAWALPNIIVGAVLVVIASVYLACRYFLDCCGGWASKPNFCWPNRFLFSKYSKSDLLRPLLLCILAVLLGFIGLVWGCSSGSAVHSHLKSIRQKASHSVAVIDALGVELDAGLRQVTYYDAARGTNQSVSLVKEATSSAMLWPMCLAEVHATVRKMSEDTVEQLYNHVAKVVWPTYLLFPLSFLLLLLLLSMALCHCTHQLPMTIFCMLSITASLVWIYFGFVSSASHYLEDSCREVEYYTQGKTNVLHALTNCSSSAVIFQKFRLSYQAMVEDFSNSTCAAVLQCCQSSSTGVSWCPSWANESASAVCGRLTVSQLRAAIQEGVVAHPVGVQKEVQSRLNALDVLLSQFAMSSAMSSCNAVFALAVPPLQSDCVLAVESSRSWNISCGLLGLASIMGLFASAMGSKRFRPLNSAFKPIVERNSR